MNTQEIDYGDSRARAALTWLIYPACVFSPMAFVIWVAEPNQAKNFFAVALLGFVTAGVMEWVHPHTLQWRKSHDDILTDSAHFILSNALSAWFRAGLVIAFFFLIDSSSEAFALLNWPTHWPLAAQFLLGLVVAEFGTYWRHRLFHEWHQGWRFHAVHHSSRRLYFLNATRFHFIDLCLSSLSGAIPLALCGATLDVVILVGIFTGLHGNWQHANVRYQLGWLNWLIAGAELHRWHHSSIIRHSNSNYGNNLILWDALFGTRCLPQLPQDIEQLGLGEYGERFPQSWWKQLLVPFRWQAMLDGEASPNVSATAGSKSEMG